MMFPKQEIVDRVKREYPKGCRVDLVNLLEAVDDILAHFDLLEDDNNRIVCSHDGSRVRYDKENPRTEIIITEFEEE